MRAPRPSAKHKIFKLVAVYALVSPSKDEKMRQVDRRFAAVGLGAEADEKNFSFVNDSPRRLLSRGAGIEGRGALRSFALTTRGQGKGDRSLCADA